ncbi:Uncharacterized protein TCM_015130 [Theobroma cacao]|uniref:Uncharacterized protein n=1 Tax=Theobroma cacao TaxID=3641 RepID=A0A061G185_THECC|nr:Uncharacterized protein TCM_015130 [Theobroma cacao]
MATSYLTLKYEIKTIRKEGGQLPGLRLASLDEPVKACNPQLGRAWAGQLNTFLFIFSQFSPPPKPKNPNYKSNLFPSHNSHFSLCISPALLSSERRHPTKFRRVTVAALTTGDRYSPLAEASKYQNN